LLENTKVGQSKSPSRIFKYKQSQIKSKIGSLSNLPNNTQNCFTNDQQNLNIFDTKTNRSDCNAQSQFSLNNGRSNLTYVDNVHQRSHKTSMYNPVQSNNQLPSMNCLPISQVLPVRFRYENPEQQFTPKMEIMNNCSKFNGYSPLTRHQTYISPFPHNNIPIHQNGYHAEINKGLLNTTACPSVCSIGNF
jgi:hypothetical protein